MPPRFKAKHKKAGVGESATSRVTKVKIENAKAVASPEVIARKEGQEMYKKSVEHVKSRENEFSGYDEDAWAVVLKDLRSFLVCLEQDISDEFYPVMEKGDDGDDDPAAFLLQIVNKAGGPFPIGMNRLNRCVADVVNLFRIVCRKCGQSPNTNFFCMPGVENRNVSMSNLLQMELLSGMLLENIDSWIVHWVEVPDLFFLLLLSPSFSFVVGSMMDCQCNLR